MKFESIKKITKMNKQTINKIITKFEFLVHKR